MALDPQILADELSAMPAVLTEAEAISNLAAAWDTYFLGATVASTAVNEGATAGAKTAMEGALVGMSAPDAGAAKIQAGITAYWGAITPTPAAIWTTTPALLPGATPPPTLSAIAAALEATFADNVANALSAADSALAIADVLHNNGGLGGIAVLDSGGSGTPTQIL